MPIGRKDIVESLRSKTYRHKLVSEHIRRGPATQIRSMRQERGWTQRELADLAGVKQNWISQIENPNYEGFSLRTLKKLASAFDVALIVRFVRFSQLVDWITNLEMEDLAPVAYDHDRALAEPEPDVATHPQILHPEVVIPSYRYYQYPLLEQLSNVVPLPIDRAPEGGTARKVQVYGR